MNNDTFQELVLHQLGVLTDKIDTLEQGQKKLQTSVNSIKRDIKCIWEDIKRIDNRLSAQEEEIQVLKSSR